MWAVFESIITISNTSSTWLLINSWPLRPILPSGSAVSKRKLPNCTHPRPPRSHVGQILLWDQRCDQRWLIWWHMNMMKMVSNTVKPKAFTRDFFRAVPEGCHWTTNVYQKLTHFWSFKRFRQLGTVKPSASGWPILNTLADPSLSEVWRRRRALHLKPRRPRPEAPRKTLGQSHSQTWSATLGNFVSTNMATENGHSNMTLLCQIFTAMNSHIWRQ